MSSKRGFTKQVRLRTTKDFQRVYESSKKFRKKGFLVLANQNKLSAPRLGISISKKKVAKAVDRNRLKRFIRESFRIRANSLPNIDLIVIFSGNNEVELTGDEVSRNLEALWLDLIDYYKKVC